MKVIGYKKCSTCNKLEKQMKEKDIEYTYREIDKENPTKEELKKWHETSGKDIKALFNTSGQIYRQMNLKDKLADMTLDEKYDLLATDGKLVKRPIILDGDCVYIGPDAKKYIEEK